MHPHDDLSTGLVPAGDPGSSSGSPRPVSRGKVAGAVMIWTIALVVGGIKLIDYAGRPGLASAAPAVWPGDATEQQPQLRGRLLVFLHPHCPCSRATLANLERTLAHCEGRLDTTLWFVIPREASESWSDTTLRASASHIVDAAVRLDVKGVEAKRFGALTSGHAMLYDPDGRLIFSGGLTPSRGHEGPSNGAASILAWAQRKTLGPAVTPVYGCPLFDQEATSGSCDGCSPVPTDGRATR
jgi:hypothetical protein